MHKYYDGIVPERGELTATDREVLDSLKRDAEALTAGLENFKFRDALKAAMEMARTGNKYLADEEPWKLIKTDPERVKTILYVAAQICGNLCVAFEPFMPFMAEKLSRTLKLKELSWDMLGSDSIVAAGTVLSEPELLFEKIDDSVVEAQVNKLVEARKANLLKKWKPESVKATVDFPTFEKMDIRVGKVLECRKVPKADKLLEFKIDDGMGGRTIVSGIAKFYAPEDLVGKEVCFMANFEPRKLKGVVSEGMILSAQDADGRLVVIGPTVAVRPGSSVG